MKKLIFNLFVFTLMIFLGSCSTVPKSTMSFETNGTIRESQKFTSVSQVVEVELSGKFLWIKSLDGSIIRVFKIIEPVSNDSNLNKVYIGAYGYSIVVSEIENFVIVKRDGKLEVAYGLPNKRWILKG